MGRMYPEDIEGFENATEGEKRVFRFLMEAARQAAAATNSTIVGEMLCEYDPYGISIIIFLAESHHL